MFYKALPVAVIFFALKVVVHYFGYECIPSNLMTMLPTILTSIVFVLGFLLAGVIADYKESEKMPNELSVSFFAIWQEIYLHYQTKPTERLKEFLVEMPKEIRQLLLNFFIKQDRNALKVLDKWALDIHKFDGDEMATVYVNRLKTELVSIRKMFNRITVVKKTDFLPSVFTTIRIIVCIFIGVFLFLDVTPWWGGAILPALFAFMIFIILYVIQDIEDPFEYLNEDLKGKGDEVDMGILTDTIRNIEEQSRSIR